MSVLGKRRQKNAFVPKAVILGNGQTVLIGLYNRVSPAVPCGNCGKLINYLIHARDIWPWYCSKACAKGEKPPTLRCAYCKGLARAVHTHNGAKICKRCAYHLRRLYRLVDGWNADMAVKVLEDMLKLREVGLLKDHYAGIDPVSREITFYQKERPEEAPGQEESRESSWEKRRVAFTEWLGGFPRGEGGVITEGPLAGRSFGEIRDKFLETGETPAEWPGK